MEKIEFELIENNSFIKYKLFGSLDWSEDGIGLALNYPEENSKSEWYIRLSVDSRCMAAAVLGVLFNDFKNGREEFKIEYGGIFDIVSSQQFEAFIHKWFDEDGVLFLEGPFLDGIFGRFSTYGYLGYPQNDENEFDKIFFWNQEAIKIIFPEKGYIDQIHGKIFIDTHIESIFNEELKKIIELFNSNDD